MQKQRRNGWLNAGEMADSMSVAGNTLRRNTDGTFTLNPDAPFPGDDEQWFYQFDNLPLEQALSETWLMACYPFGPKTLVGHSVLYRERILVDHDLQGVTPTVEAVQAMLSEQERERVTMTTSGNFPLLVFAPEDGALLEEIEKRLEKYYHLGVVRGIILRNP